MASTVDGMSYCNGIGEGEESEELEKNMILFVCGCVDL